MQNCQFNYRSGTQHRQNNRSWVRWNGSFAFFFCAHTHCVVCCGTGEKSAFRLHKSRFLFGKRANRSESALIKTLDEKPIHKLAANNDSRQHELIEICSIVQITIVKNMSNFARTVTYTQCVWHFMHKSKSLPQTLNFCKQTRTDEWMGGERVRERERSSNQTAEITNDSFDLTWSEYIKMCTIIRNKLEWWEKNNETELEKKMCMRCALKQVDYCRALVKHFQAKKKAKKKLVLWARMLHA